LKVNPATLDPTLFFEVLLLEVTNFKQ